MNALSVVLCLGLVWGSTGCGGATSSNGGGNPSPSTAPVISNISATNTTASGATISWTTNVAADSQVDYGPTTAYGQSSPLDPGMVTSHVVNLSGLSAATLYHYRVKSRDASGNPAIGADFTFTTAAATTAPDFSLSVTPATQTMAPSGATTYSVDVTFLNGFTSTNVVLSVADLPVGVSGVFTPNPLPHQGRSDLTLTGNGNAAPGNYILTTSASAEGITHFSNVTLIISTNPDFSIGLSPTTQSVPAGGSISYQVTLSSMNGFASPVVLSVSVLPSGTNGFFSPNPTTPPATATFILTTSATTPQGQFNLSIAGTSGSLVHTAQVVLIVTSPGSAWMISVVGSTGAQYSTVRVGAARNDGVNRVYVGTVNTGRVLEFSWNGSGWAGPVDIGGSPTTTEIHNMAMGPGRNDGVIRIYAGSLDGNLYEITRAGSGWMQGTVGAPTDVVTHAAVGTRPNDSVNRVYATRGTGVWEYTWNGTGWTAVLIGNVTSGIAHGIVLGNGRGDGVNRLYIASTASGTYEASFSSGSWTITSMGDSGDVRNVGVGAGRNDGTLHVYAAEAAGRMRELTWNGSRWTFTEMNSGVGDALIHAYVLPGRNDNTQRVYSSSGNGNAYEFTWNGSGWTLVTLGGGSGYMYGFHFGVGRNDGVLRLYGASFNQQVYEYTWSATTP